MITLARLVLLVVALLVVVACLYAIASIVVRVLRGEWLQRAGGFEPELTGPSHSLADIALVADHLDEDTGGTPILNSPAEERGGPDDPRRAASN